MYTWMGVSVHFYRIIELTINCHVQILYHRSFDEAIVSLGTLWRGVNRKSRMDLVLVRAILHDYTLNADGTGRCMKSARILPRFPEL